MSISDNKNATGTSYPRESFASRDYGITGVRLSVCLLPRKLNKTWTDLDEIFFQKVPRGKSKRKFVYGYDR